MENNMFYLVLRAMSAQYTKMQYIANHGRAARRARHRDMENALLNLFTA